MVTTNKIPASKAIEQFLHATGLKKLALDPLDVLNMAGDHLINTRPWRWLQGANAFLGSRGNISISDGTWTEATKLLTSTGAWANYTFVDEDHIDITGGTGVIAKQIEVASKTDSDSIVLKKSLSSAAGDLAAGDIAGTLHSPTLELPDNCAHVVGIAGTTSLVNSVQLVDHQDINLLRGQWDREDDTGFYRAAVIYVGLPPRQVLDVHPDFGNNVEDVFRINYLKSWTRVTEDETTLPIPRFMNAAFMQLCRHFALGWEDEDEEGLEDRLLRWEDGRIFKAAAKQDGRAQQNWGRMRGGAVRRSPHKVFPNALASEVAGPS